MSDFQAALDKMTTPVAEVEPVVPESPAFEEALNAVAMKQADRTEEVGRRFAEGLTFGASEVVESISDAYKNDIPYDVAEYQRQQRETDAETASPFATALAELTGGVITGGLSSAAMTSKGVNLATQGAVEGGVYAGLSEGPESIFAGVALGGAAGRVFDAIVTPSASTRKAGASTEGDSVQPQPTEWLEMTDASSEAATKWVSQRVAMLEMDARRAGKTLDMKEVNSQLRGEASKLGISRQVLKRMLTKGPDIVKTIPEMNDFQLRKLTKGQLVDDLTGKAVPDARKFGVKARQWLSPLNTLAEKTVGPKFANTMVRAMNRVTMQNQSLDGMWVGMESLRNKASTDVAFNNSLLDAANINLPEGVRQQAFIEARSQLDEADAARLDQFYNEQQEFLGRYKNSIDASAPTNRTYMHSQKKAEVDDAAKTLEDTAKVANPKPRDTAALDIQRGRLAADDDSYENIFDSHHMWMKQNLTAMNLSEMFRLGGVPVTGKTQQELKKKLASGDLTFDLLERRLRGEGYNSQQIGNAKQVFKDLIVNSNKAMAAEARLVRNLGYASTIGNPYGAAMNVHDLFNASFEFGVGPVISSIFKKNGINMNPEEMGLAQQIFGDFVRSARRGEKSLSDIDMVESLADKSQDLLDWSMKWSGFRKLDLFGKEKILGASVLRAKREVTEDAARFNARWGDTFSDVEMKELRNALQKGNYDDPLVRDLAMFDLFQLQPINAAAQTQMALRNPNMRLGYMLKGFAIKQFDLIERRIAGEWKQGNKRGAIENALKYAVLSGGGFGVVNELRGTLKGEMPDPMNIPVSAFYQVLSVLTFGAAGANDYGYDKFMDDPLTGMVANILPPVGATIPGAMAEDVADALRSGDYLPDETLYSIPVVGKLFKGVDSALN